MMHFAQVMALAASMARGSRDGFGASVGAPFPQGMMPGGMPGGMPMLPPGMHPGMMPQGMMPQQAGGGSVGDWGGGCNIGPADWRSYPTPCYPQAYAQGPYGVPGVDLGVPPGVPGPLPLADLAMGGPGQLGPYPFGSYNGCDFPWQFYCALQSKRRGPVCTSFGIGETVLPPAPLGAASGPSVTVNVPLPGNPMRTKCFVIPSSIASAVVIDSINVNGQNQLLGSAIPGEVFSEVAEGCGNNFESDLIGAFNGNLTIVARNITNAPVTLRGAFGVTAIIC